MSKIFAIYPLDKSSSTSFLNRIHTFETRKLGDTWHCYKVHFSDEDHERCIQQAKDNHFIFYMGHGGETPSYMELVQNMEKCQLILLPLKKIRITIIKRFL